MAYSKKGFGLFGVDFNKDSKYHNKKIVTEDGAKFDSLKEYRRWQELCIMERAGEISELVRQVPYVLVPSQKYLGQTIKPVKYVADFVYRNKRGIIVVEDVKGVRTKDYLVKKKLMLYVHNVMITEV